MNSFTLINVCTSLCAGVGKSCLLLRFSEDSFTSSFITTIGCVTSALVMDAQGMRDSLHMRQVGAAW